MDELVGSLGRRAAGGTKPTSIFRRELLILPFSKQAKQNMNNALLCVFLFDFVAFSASVPDN
jgi:hypothetical protein